MNDIEPSRPEGVRRQKRRVRRVIALVAVAGAVSGSYLFGLTRIEHVAYQAAPKSNVGGPSRVLKAELQESPEPLLAIAVRPLRSPWTANKDIRERVNVLIMNNFDWAYMQGGIIPRQGAEISLVADASKTSLPPVDTLIGDFLKGDRNASITKIKIAGCDVRQVESESVFTPSLVYKRLAVFMPVRHKDSPQLYRFVLSYNADDNDALGKSFKDAFNQVLTSVTLTMPSATKCNYF